MLTSLIKIIIDNIQIYNEFIRVDYHNNFLFILSTEVNEFFTNKFYLYDKNSSFLAIKYDYLNFLNIYFDYYNVESH